MSEFIVSSGSAASESSGMQGSPEHRRGPRTHVDNGITLIRSNSTK